MAELGKLENRPEKLLAEYGKAATKLGPARHAN